MNNRDWRLINDPDFEEMVRNSLPDSPPDDVAHEVTPWRTATDRALVGLTLNLLILNFLRLNYILPAIGVICMLLGFRTLRRENGWFRGCYVLTILLAVRYFPLLVLNATIYQKAVYELPFFSVLTVLNTGIGFALIVCLGNGFRKVQRKSGLPAHAGRAFALIAWYALICLLALLQYSGIILGVGLVAAYIFCIRALFKLSKELDEAGYAVQAAPVRMRDRTLVGVILALLAVGTAVGYLFLNHYPMKWTAVESSGCAQVEEIKTQLASLGFPEEILDDLTAGDIQACEGALRVVVDVHDSSVGRDDVPMLRNTGIAVELPGEREQWKLFHHFRWLEDPGFYGTESIQLWPADHSEGWSFVGEVSGQVLCTKDGLTYAAPYYSLDRGTYVYNSILWGENTSDDIFATFSMPGRGEEYRGYISYAVQETQDGYLMDSWVNYTHQQTWRQYPVLTAKQHRIANSWNEAGAFFTVQGAIQFSPTEGEIELS